MSRSVRTRWSVSAARSRNASTSAVTIAARSTVRPCPASSSPQPPRTSVPSRWPAAVTATAHMPSASASRPVSGGAPHGGRVGERIGQPVRAGVRRCPHRAFAVGTPTPALARDRPVRREPAPVDVEHHHPAGEHLAEHRGDVVDPAAARAPHRRTGRAPRRPARCPRGPLDRAARVAAVAAARRDWTSETAASAASEPSSATSSWWNARRVRFEANSTPTNSSPTSSGVPQIPMQPLVVDRRVDLARCAGTARPPGSRRSSRGGGSARRARPARPRAAAAAPGTAPTPSPPSPACRCRRGRDRDRVR